jgi:MFS family permease
VPAPTPVRPRARAHLARRVIALSGAWLPIGFTSAVLLPQRVEQLADAATWTVIYASLSALGWAAAVVGLVASGWLRDRRARRAAQAGVALRGTRRASVGVAAALIPIGLALSWAPDLATLGVLWVVSQLLAAFAVTALAADVADTTPRPLVAAAAIGVSPILSLFLGAIVGSALSVTLGLAVAPRFALIAGVAVALLLLAPRPEDTLDAHLSPLAEIAPVDRTTVRLLAAVALVDTGTVTATFAIVPLVLRLPSGQVSGATTITDLLLLIATVAAGAAAIAAARWRRGPSTLFALTALLLMAMLVTATIRDLRALLAVAVVAGVAIGASNMATFGVFLTERPTAAGRATGLGLLNAVPSLPAVLVPTVALVLLRARPEAGLDLLLLGAAVLVLAGALLMAPVGRRGVR